MVSHYAFFRFWVGFAFLLFIFPISALLAQSTSFFEKTGDFPIQGMRSVQNPYGRDFTPLAVNQEGVMMSMRILEGGAAAPEKLVFMSADGGESWTDITAFLPPSEGEEKLTGSLKTMNRNRRMWNLHAIGEAFIIGYSHVVISKMVYLRSIDNGQSWEQIELPEGIDGILFPDPSKGCSDPSTQFLSFVESYYDDYGKSEKKYFKSTDLGESWKQYEPEPVKVYDWTNPGDPDLYLDPSDQTLYTAQAWNAGHPADQQITRYGAFSPVGYRIRENGMDFGNEQVALVYKYVRVGSVGPDDKGLASSKDGGKSWKIVATGTPDEIAFWDCESRPYSYVYVPEGNYKLTRSANRGRAWSEAGEFPVNVIAYATVFGQDGHLYGFENEGSAIYRSRETICCTSNQVSEPSPSVNEQVAAVGELLTFYYKNPKIAYDCGFDISDFIYKYHHAGSSNRETILYSAASQIIDDQSQYLPFIFGTSRLALVAEHVLDIALYFNDKGELDTKQGSLSSVSYRAPLSPDLEIISKACNSVDDTGFLTKIFDLLIGNNEAVNIDEEIDESEPCIPLRRIDVRTYSGAEFKAHPNKTTTILGLYEPDMKKIIPLVYPKDYNVGTPIGKSENACGFNILNLPNEIFTASPKTFFQKHNLPWLAKAVERGDEIILATPPEFYYLFEAVNKPNVNSGFAQEVKFLVEKDYKPQNISEGRWEVIKGYYE